MYCNNCGKEINENGKYCPYCGNPIQIHKEENEAESEKNKDIGGFHTENKDPKRVPLKSKKGIAIAFLILIVVIIVIVPLGMGNGSEEVIEKLLEYTELYQTDSGYVFSSNEGWELNYTDVNEYAKIEETQMENCVSDAFGIIDVGSDGTFSYDYDTENLNMYFDVTIPEGGTLSIITYNMEDDEFILNVDGERYEPSDEFSEYLTIYNIKDILVSDVSGFKEALERMDLSVEQISEISVEDIEKYIDNKEIEEKKQNDVEYNKASEKQNVEVNDTENEEEYVFPDSDKKYLSEDEIRSVDLEKMRFGRNEIFARHGYIFNDDTYREYFEGKSWYKGTITSDQFNADEEFNDFEKKNVELIKEVEDAVGNLDNSFIGKSGVYICTDPNLSVTGWIDIQRTGNTFDFRLLTLETEYDLITGSAEMIDNHTIQLELDNMTITCTWSDSDHMYVNCSEVYQGMDAALLDETINGHNYEYSAEFN